MEAEEAEKAAKKAEKAAKKKAKAEKKAAKVSQRGRGLGVGLWGTLELGSGSGSVSGTAWYGTVRYGTVRYGMRRSLRTRR